MPRTGNESGASREEQLLLHALTEQQRVFDRVTSFLAETRPDGEAASTDSNRISRLQEWLRKVTSAQTTVAAARVRFEESGARLTDPGRRELKQREAALHDCSRQLDQLLENLSQLRSGLLPELDSEVRRRSMQSAYQKSLKSY